MNGYSLLFRNWWSVLARGILAVLLGLALFAWPGLALATLVALFVVYCLLDGAAVIIGSFLKRRQEHVFPLGLFLSGVLSVVFGIIAAFWPGITALALLYLVGIWAIIRGVLDIWGGIIFRSVIRHEVLLVLDGVASIVFGILVFAWPAAGMLAIMWLLGIYIIIYGLLAIVLSVRLYDLQHGPTEARPTVA